MKCKQCGEVILITGEYVKTTPRIVWFKCSNINCALPTSYFENEIDVEEEFKVLKKYYGEEV